MNEPKQKNENGGISAGKKRLILSLCAVAWAAVIALSAWYYADGILNGKFAAPPGIADRLWVAWYESSDRGNGEPTDPSAESGSPSIGETAVMTVNGETIPVDWSLLACAKIETGSNGDGYVASFGGKTADQTFQINACFWPDPPKAGGVYKCSEGKSDEVGAYVVLQYSGVGLDSYRGIYDSAILISYFSDEMSDVEITVAEFEPQRYILLSVSGTAYYNGLTFEFSVSGKVNFDRSADGDTLQDWFDQNQLTTRGTRVSEETKKTTTTAQPAAQPVTKSEITIGGKTYSTDLTYLDLTGQALTDKDIQELQYMTKLTWIVLNDNNLTDISVLRNIPTLEEINADNNQIADISFMSDLKKLKIVVMNNNRVKDISVFSKFTTIEKIWLEFNEIKDISPIAGNKALTEVGFSGNTIGDVSALRHKSKLAQLNLNYCGIKDISPLATCTSLRELSLVSNAITDFSPLANLERMETVYLDNNGTMSWDTAATLFGIKISRVLTLRDMGIETNEEMASMITRNLRYGSDDAFVHFVGILLI